MEDPLGEIEHGSDNEASEESDVDAPINLIEPDQQIADLRPFLFINTHEFPPEVFEILDLIEQDSIIVNIPDINPNDRFLYSNGSWALLLREGEVQSLIFLNLERSRIMRLQVFDLNDGEIIYAHNIRTGTFIGNVNMDDYVVYLIECPQAHQHGLIIWMSGFGEMLNDGDGHNNGNDGLTWTRRIVEVHPPAFDAFSLVYWGHALYWIIETGEVRCHNLGTQVNIRYVIPPRMLFHNDNHPHGPRAFLAENGDVILYVSAPANVVEGVLGTNLRVGRLVFLEDGIGYVQECMPSTLYIPNGAIFLNRGQGGVFVADAVSLDGVPGSTVWIGPVPEECLAYFLDTMLWNVTTGCQLQSCEGLWFFSANAVFCADPWEVIDVAMFVDQFNPNPGLLEHNEEEEVEHEDDDNSSAVTEGVTKVVQVGYEKKIGISSLERHLKKLTGPALKNTQMEVTKSSCIVCRKVTGPTAGPWC